jgi:hypothetical protein
MLRLTIADRKHGEICERHSRIMATSNPAALHEVGWDRTHHGSSTSGSLHGAQVSRRDSLCCRCQRGLQSLNIRMQIRLPAAGATVIGTMLIGDFLVDGSESGSGETHYRHGRKLCGTKDIAEGCHDGPMHLCAGRFAVSDLAASPLASSSLFAPWRAAVEATTRSEKRTLRYPEHAALDELLR